MYGNTDNPNFNFLGSKFSLNNQNINVKPQYGEGQGNSFNMYQGSVNPSRPFDDGLSGFSAGGFIPNDEFGSKLFTNQSGQFGASDSRQDTLLSLKIGMILKGWNNRHNGQSIQVMNQNLEKFCIVGHLVNVIEIENSISFIVDDGSGVISCDYVRPDTSPWKKNQLISLCNERRYVKVYGTIYTLGKIKPHVQVASIRFITDPDEIAFHECDVMYQITRINHPNEPVFTGPAKATSPSTPSIQADATVNDPIANKPSYFNMPMDSLHSGMSNPQISNYYKSQNPIDNTMQFQSKEPFYNTPRQNSNGSGALVSFVCAILSHHKQTSEVITYFQIKARVQQNPAFQGILDQEIKNVVSELENLNHLIKGNDENTYKIA